MAKPEPKPFFQTRGDFLPSLENFANKAVNLWQAADILCSSGAEFPGKEILQQRVTEFRAACMDENDET